MANLDETPDPTGGESPGAGGGETPPSADPRVRELERENARLRAELAELTVKFEIERDIVNSYSAQRMPKTEAELLHLAKTGQTFKELLHELFPESDSGERT